MKPTAAVPEKLELSRRSERAVSYLRLACALICALASIWLLFTATGGISAAVGVIGLLAAVGWVFSFRLTRRRTQSENQWLELTREGLNWRREEKVEQIGWPDVADIDADEEKLVVRVNLHTGISLSIPPSYGNLGLYELDARIQAAWKASAEVPGPSDGIAEGVVDAEKSPKMKPAAG